mmetsp:Transcript_40322/g.116540  ORF Transcript_40322/g.116540 Transcript_40322/m.116540 type:complete len:211 (+) Transcript_40322:575-1207(+)
MSGSLTKPERSSSTKRSAALSNGSHSSGRKLGRRQPGATTPCERRPTSTNICPLKVCTSSMATSSLKMARSPSGKHLIMQTPEQVKPSVSGSSRVARIGFNRFATELQPQRALRGKRTMIWPLSNSPTSSRLPLGASKTKSLNATQYASTMSWCVLESGVSDQNFLPSIRMSSQALAATMLPTVLHFIHRAPSQIHEPSSNCPGSQLNLW